MFLFTTQRIAKIEPPSRATITAITTIGVTIISVLLDLGLISENTSNHNSINSVVKDIYQLLKDGLNKKDKKILYLKMMSLSYNVY